MVIGLNGYKVHLLTFVHQGPSNACMICFKSSILENIMKSYVVLKSYLILNSRDRRKIWCVGDPSKILF